MFLFTGILPANARVAFFYWGQFVATVLLAEQKQVVIAKCWGKYDFKISLTTLKHNHFRTTQMAQYTECLYAVKTMQNTCRFPVKFNLRQFFQFTEQVVIQLRASL